MRNCATRWIALSCFAFRLAGAHVCQYVVATISAARSSSPTSAIREICLFMPGSSRRVGPFGDEQQAREQQEVRDDGRAAVGDERERDPRQRDDPQHAADDDERLEREAEGEAGGEELGEAVV